MPLYFVIEMRKCTDCIAAMIPGCMIWVLLAIHVYTYK